MRARWQNYRGYVDTDWLSLKPLTLLVGANNVGKTSLYSPLLLLKQTLEEARPQTALLSRGPLFDAGKYKDFVRNHDLSNKVILSLDLEFPIEVTGFGSSGLTPENLPQYLEVTFDAADEVGLRTRLRRYRLLNHRGEQVFMRSLQRDDTYGAYGSIVPDFSLFEKNVSTVLRRGIRRESRTHFLFDGLSFLRLDWGREMGGTPDGFSEWIESSFNAFSIQQKMVETITEVLSRVSYLGPLRALPKRTYSLSSEPPLSVGTEGQFAPEMLFRDQVEGDGDLVREVGDFLLACGYDRIRFEESSDSESFSMFIGGKSGANLVDSGMGLSQILPLITQSLAARKGSLSIVQQPEIHLNPALQVKLMDHLAGHLADGRRVLIETHSEHLLLRLRRLVSEEIVSADDVSLLYADKVGERSEVREIGMSDTGGISRDAWPRNFFAEQLEDSLVLAREQSRRAKRGK